MMCNIDQQVLLNEALDSRLARNGRDDLERRGSDIDIRDENAGMEVVGGQVLCEGAHLLDSYAGVRQELDPDGADVWAGGVGVCGRRGIGVPEHHGIGWTG